MAAPPLGVNGGDVYYQNIISGTGSTAIQKGFYQWAGGVWSPLPKSETVASLLDVDLTTAPKDGEALAWDLKTLKWKPVGASATLKGLTDVNVKGVGDTNVLKYDSAQDKWIPIAATLGGRFLQDVNLRDKAVNSGDVLVFNGADSVWQNQSIGLDWLNDVELNSKTQAKDDLLQFDGTNWVNWKPNYLNDTTGYTKVQIDAKLTTLLQGVEHGLAVEALTNTPPATPAADDLYIVGTVPTGAWVGHANELANWDGKAWQFEAARDKEAHLVEDQQATFHWNGTAWVKIATAIAGGSSAQAGVGEIVPWIGDNVPASDYLECIGQIVAVSIYPELHTAIGNKYNTGTAADGTTTFALPDLRGYFLRGDKAGLTVGTKQQWTTGGPRNKFTNDSQGNHRHQLHFDIEGTAAQRLEDRKTGLFHNYASIASRQAGTVYGGDTNGDFITETGAHTHTISGGDTETAPDHFAVKWLIRYKPINGGAKGDKGDKGIGVPATATAGDVLTYDGATNAWIGKAAAPTMVVAAAAPATPKLGQEWFDTANKVLMVCTQADPSVVWTPSGLSYPRLAGNKAIEHHTYGSNSWEETTIPIADISRWIPTGHLYKLELDARLMSFHGGNAYLNTYFTGTALYGNAAARGDQQSVLVPAQTPHAGYSRHITGLNAAGGNLIVHIASTTTASNGDRQVFGELLLWDLGLDADLPSLV
jgi:microcystin-dependent protein